MRIFGLALLVLVLAGCAAGDGSQWKEAGAEPAGFFAGLWHGALLFFALIISFFADTVSIYEVVNSGVGYNIGFVLGVFCIYGSGTHMTVTKAKKKSKDRCRVRIERYLEDDDEWDEIGEKLAKKIKTKLRSWLAEDG